MFEYQAVLVSVALAVYAACATGGGLRRWRRSSPGRCRRRSRSGAYHTALFGRPWRFPFANIENPVFAQTAHRAGFHGLSLPHLAAFPRFLFSPSYGLFAFSPVLALGVVGVVALFVRGPRGRAARRRAGDGGLPC